MASLAFSVIATVILVVVLVWAIKSGQFRQQDRARYLPLEDEAARSLRPSEVSRQRPSPRFRPFPKLAAVILAAAVALGVILLLIH